MALLAQKGSSPRSRRTRFIAVALTLVVVVSVAVAARDLGRADALDSWWLRARFSLRENLHPAVPDNDIVLVDMDDATLAKWPEPIVLWGPHFAAAINKLTTAGAKLIAIDWIQPISADKYIPGHDEPLGQALSNAPDIVLVKELAANGHDWIRPTTDLLYSLPGSAVNPDAQLGYAALAGRDSIVASNLPAFRGDDGTVESSFSARIAERLYKSSARLGDTWSLSGGLKPISVPLRQDGSVLINYRDGSGTDGAFRHYSLADVAGGTSVKDDPRFKNKIVLIGASYQGSNDSHYIPFLGGASGMRLIPGVEIQANLLRTLLDSRPIDEPASPWIAIYAIVLSFIVALCWLRFTWVGSVFSTMAALLSWLALSAFLFVGHAYAMPLALPVLCALLTSALVGSYRALGEERERRHVLGLWGRYQDPRIVEYLLEHPEARGGQGYETEVTVLFADLKNFTKTVEHLEPAAALQVLNRYLALMTDIIRDEYGGIVDKYLGDGLLAQWGAPQPWDAPRALAGDHHATKAVRACLELQRRASELAVSIGGESGVTFGLRLTLHTGPVVVGWVGAEKIEFTIIGDTVNVCARLQETAKELACEFVISESTYNSASAHVVTGQHTEVMIRGRDKPLQVYEVVGERVAETT